eukprot:3586605-Amphidinium_carterae.1
MSSVLGPARAPHTLSPRQSCYRSFSSERQNQKADYRLSGSAWYARVQPYRNISDVPDRDDFRESQPCMYRDWGCTRCSLGEEYLSDPLGVHPWVCWDQGQLGTWCRCSP